MERHGSGATSKVQVAKRLDFPDFSTLTLQFLCSEPEFHLRRHGVNEKSKQHATIEGRPSVAGFRLAIDDGHLNPRSRVLILVKSFDAFTNLVAAVAQGRFRLDLLARLRAHEVELVPLRVRRVDLLALADAVLPSTPLGVASWMDAFDADAVEALACHGWRDNLRGLRGVLARLIAATATVPVGLDALPQALRPLVPDVTPPPMPPVAATPEPRAEASTAAPPLHVLSRSPPKAELESLLGRCNGNVKDVATALGRDRKQVYRWLAAVGIGEAELAAWRQGPGDADPG